LLICGKLAGRPKNARSAAGTQVKIGDVEVKLGMNRTIPTQSLLVALS
jgi:hypothetical protein